jgi:ABC-2 type transport system ATP-binding protein
MRSHPHAAGDDDRATSPRTGTLAEMRHLTRLSVEAELRAPAALDGMPGVHELTVTGTVVRCGWITPPWMRLSAACTRPGSGL